MTRWKGESIMMLGANSRRYKFFWQGCNKGTAGFGVFIVEIWIDSVVRVYERIMYVKLLIRNQIVNIGFGTRNAEGDMILEFGDAVGRVVCNIFLKKEDSKLITYQSGDNRSMIDNLMVRKTYLKLLNEEILPTYNNTNKTEGTSRRSLASQAQPTLYLEDHTWSIQ